VSSSIVVIGAGPAGLAAALGAARRGHDVTVVERASVVGGMAASFDVAGLRVDHGSHRLHPAADPAVLDELRGLLGSALQTRRRNGRIRVEGRWLPFPFGTADLIRGLPPSFAAGAAADLVARPFRRRAEPVTFADAVRGALGRTVAERFYEPYARKLWDTDPSRLAAELAGRRVAAARPGGLSRLRRGGAARTFLYPRGGFGTICERLADAAVDAGARVSLDTTVRAVDLDHGGVETTHGSFTAERVWSTAPVAALARLCTPAPPASVATAAGRLHHRGVVLVYLVLDRARWTEFDAHYFPGPDVPVARISEPKNYRDDPDDPFDRTVLCAEWPCWPRDDDAVWSAGDDELAARLVDSLAAAGLPPCDPIDVVVERVPRVYPVYELGFDWHLAALELWAASRPRLLTFGRQGLFVPDNTHHALAMGRAAAAALRPDGSFATAGWVRERDAFREHVVED
jgi:protoporphyrinogen oxidase